LPTRPAALFRNICGAGRSRSPGWCLVGWFCGLASESTRKHLKALASRLVQATALATARICHLVPAGPALLPACPDEVWGGVPAAFAAEIIRRMEPPD